jgi:hypothetical protein
MECRRQVVPIGDGVETDAAALHGRVRTELDQPPAMPPAAAG